MLIEKSKTKRILTTWYKMQHKLSTCQKSVNSCTNFACQIIWQFSQLLHGSTCVNMGQLNNCAPQFSASFGIWTLPGNTGFLKQTCKVAATWGWESLRTANIQLCSYFELLGATAKAGLTVKSSWVSGFVLMNLFLLQSLLQSLARSMFVSLQVRK